LKLPSKKRKSKITNLKSKMSYMSRMIFTTIVNGRMVKSALLLTCLTLCACLPARKQVIECDGIPGLTDCTFVGPEMLNTRLEINSQPDLHQSKSVWIHAGEELIAKWDSYKLFVSYNGANCDFSNFTQATDDCWLCDPCDTSATSEQRCPWINDGLAFDYPRVVSYNGSPLDTEPTLVLESHFTSGCSARGFAPVPFTPTDNAIYGVLPPKIASSSYTSFPEDVLLRVFVVLAGVMQPATYELEKYARDPSTGKVWYKWTVQGDPVWADNFSKNVRIGQVRILTGRPGTDPNTGRFRLEDAKVVRPSRILFFSDFAAIDTSNGNLSNGSDILSHPFENYNRCYVNPSREDGDINLAGIPAARTGCRQDSPGPNSRENDFAATPTYLVSEPESQLTWFVEFYELEGADFDPTTAVFDPIPPDAFLAIEFSIEQVP